MKRSDPKLGTMAGAREGSLLACVDLTVTPAGGRLLAERIGGRQGHFMKPAMLQSQLATLEPPADALVVDITPPPEQIVALIRRSLSL